MDTPGHADFGGEVERVLRMADGAVVLVDAAEGPMPQTRFVLSKALECRLRPVVVVNKIDRPDARPLEVLDEILGLFLELGADDDLADFPFVYASSRGGYASHDPAVREGTMEPLLDLVLEKIPGPVVDPDGAAADARDHARLVGLRRPDRDRPRGVGHAHQGLAGRPLDGGRHPRAGEARRRAARSTSSAASTSKRRPPATSPR